MTVYLAVKCAATLTFVCVTLIAPGYSQQNLDNPRRNDINAKNCGENQFECRNGECIQSELLCDGRADCSDQSDETQLECTKPELTCPDYAFRCSYGACVNGDATCNGIKDCIDNSDELLPRCPGVSAADVELSCREEDFRCTNGQCISATSLCDGIVDCDDRSDETISACGSFSCNQLVFRCNYGACIDGDLTCNGVSNCADASDEDPLLCGGPSSVKPVTPRPTPRPIPRPTPTPKPTGPLPSRPSSCLVPPQPTNGQWKLHRLLCKDGLDCDVPQGVELEPGSQLVYTCVRGYKIRGSTDVYCGARGNWSSIPVCIEIKCGALNSVSTTTSCSLFGDYVSCDSSVPPKTRAEVMCRVGYRKDTTSITTRRETVECNAMGKWEPDPIRCVPGPLTVYVEIEGGVIRVRAKVAQNATGINLVDVTNDKVIVYTGQRGSSDIEPNIDVTLNAPIPQQAFAVCGVANTRQTPLVVNGSVAKIGDFPWHATLYVQRNTEKGLTKEFHCGATVIQTNLLLTAAHCVYDERIKATENPANLFVATGNTFRDYDSPLHDLRIVRKGAVKNVYTYCKYYGLGGNYASDIAVLELKEPFEFSGILLPACLDVSGYSEQVLEPGALGKVAGFGRTATGTSSGVLQTLSLPYISYSQCKASSSLPDNEVFISNDKFCAGFVNGSAVCEGDSGGGLVFKKSDLWYVMGIVSVGLGVDIDNGEKTCNKYSYSLYTKVSTYMAWIQDIMFQLERYKSFPSCGSAV